MKFNSIRALLDLATHHDLEIDQMHVKNAFLYGDSDEQMFMKIMEGIDSPRGEDYVRKLQDNLYGLKEAAKCCIKKSALSWLTK